MAQTVTLNNGVRMPMLGYGVYQVSNAECERCVLDAISVGYRAIDTAQSYGNEEAVGSAVQKCGVPRDELFLTTKVWISNAGYEAAKDSIDRSLQKLKTDYIDLLLFTACAADGSAAESGAGSAPSSAPAGWTDAEIDDVLQAEIPPDAYFNARGFTAIITAAATCCLRIRTFCNGSYRKADERPHGARVDRALSGEGDAAPFGKAEITGFFAAPRPGLNRTDAFLTR